MRFSLPAPIGPPRRNRCGAGAVRNGRSGPAPEGEGEAGGAGAAVAAGGKALDRAPSMPIRTAMVAAVTARRDIAASLDERKHVPCR